MNKGMGIYLYGIVEEKEDVNLCHIGVANERIETIRYKGIGAVVNKIPENYNITIEDARTHETVMRKVMENTTIIPIAFGTVVKDISGIEKILKRGYITFKHTLNRMRGKFQVNVTASWNEEAALKTILREDKELSTLRKEIMKNSADQNLRIELGRRVKKALDGKRREIVPAIIASLQGLSDGFEENKIKDTDTILNASFLLEKSREQKFYAKADELERKYAEEISLVVVGPLPPYNFTRIEIKNLGFKALKEAQQILGLGETSNISEIRQAFNHLAQTYHPDLHPHDQAAAERFEKIRRAYDVLVEYCEHHPCSFKRSEVEDTIIIREKPS